MVLPGFNTDFKYKGLVYHVQTEDGGTDNPVIVSLIYRGGRILASKKTSYAHLIGNEDMISRLRELLEQHADVVAAEGVEGIRGGGAGGARVPRHRGRTYGGLTL